MSEQQVDKGRRRFLTLATSAAGGVAAVGVATPFLLSFFPSERAKAAGAPVEVDISKLEPGQKINVEWRGKPVWVLSRTPEQLQNLPKLDGKLVDPKSEMPQQPVYCQNATRSIKPEISVLVGVCTHLGCAPEYLPEVKPQPFDPDWKGGYFCPCHKSRFDMAGRVFQGVPAPTNLVVPPHHYADDNTIVVGVDPQGA